MGKDDNIELIKEAQPTKTFLKSDEMDKMFKRPNENNPSLGKSKSKGKEIKLGPRRPLPSIGKVQNIIRMTNSFEPLKEALTEMARND